MSKVLTDTEVLEVVQKIITGDNIISESLVYEKFLKDLGSLVANYCGGDCTAVSEPLGDGDPDDTWCIHFEADESVPEDGGVYASYDTDVTVEEWRQQSKEEETSKKQFYTIFVWGDVEPEIFGPFDTEEERDEKSHEIRRKEGSDEGGLYMLNVSASGNLEVGAYTGGFFDQDDGLEEDGGTPEQVVSQFLNHYRCPRCKHEWADVWTATCDDDCPNCHCRHISPHKSEDYPGRGSSE